MQLAALARLEAPRLMLVVGRRRLAAGSYVTVGHIGLADSAIHAKEGWNGSSR